MSVSIQTSQNVLLEYEPASLGERILAALIDYVIILAWVILLSLLGRNMGSGDKIALYFWIGFVVLPIMLYDLLFEVFLNGQSLGKRAMGIRVVMLDGSQPGLGAYLIRWILRIIESPVFLGGIVAIIAIAVNGRGQRIGDMAAATTVVKLKAPVSLDEVTYRELSDSHQVTFPEAARLSDRDIGIIREVLQRGSDEVMNRTAEKVRTLLEVEYTTTDYAFLDTVVNDYQYLVSK
ncbi:RDD family protein [Tellurirhabdus rosea]|uniref:RDD family protein n=1 Tax=Tellurirhabdus rosea TaxID=2674997 RepID=UPI0022561229|nr:RDD family protein [Tellurirhabdus rosea]